MAVNKVRQLPSRGSITVEGAWITGSIAFNDEEGANFLRSQETDEARSEAFETAARIGLRSLSSADHAYTERLLDQKLDRMAEELERAAATTLKKATDSFEARWSKQIDDDLSRRLDAHAKEIGDQLAAVFGENSAGSVQESVRRTLAEYSRRVKQEIQDDRPRLRRELSEVLNGAGNPDHPLARISAQLTELRKDVITELEAARAARDAQEASKGTSRGGMKYQDEVHAAITGLLKVTNDEVDLKGRSPGPSGGADGDVVITVDPDLASGARIAVEITQETKLRTPRLKEMLQKANEDRASAAAVVVIRNPSILGGQRFSEFPGLGFVAVFEPEDPEPYRSLALNVALKNAKAVAVRSVRPESPQRDDERIERAVVTARHAFEAMDTVIGNQTKIINLAEKTGTKARAMRLAVLDALEEIDGALSA